LHDAWLLLRNARVVFDGLDMVQIVAKTGEVAFATWGQQNVKFVPVICARMKF
jgi:hypothetical protein